jgi:sugar-specific transcriptional regulator TrmB
VDALDEPIVETDPLFQELGLTPPEIEIYRFLLQVPSASAADIVRATGQPRARIYDAMRHMVQRGWAREQPTRPIQFVAMPVDEVLQRTQEELQARIGAVQRIQAIAPQLVRYGSTHVGPAMRIRDVRVFSGRRTCMLQLRRVITGAQTDLLLHGNDAFGRRLVRNPDFWTDLKAAGSRGVQVRFAVGNDLALQERLLPYLVGSSVRLERLGPHAVEPVIVCISDSRSFQILAQPDDGDAYRGDDIGVEIANRLLARAHLRTLRPPEDTLIAELHPIPSQPQSSPLESSSPRRL